MTTGCSVCTRPISRAMASAVCGWSPVTMMTRMPAAAQRAMAAGTSGRGGSSSPTRPDRVRPCLRRSRQAGRRSVPGEGQHAQAGLGHLVLRGEQTAFRGGIERHDPSRSSCTESHTASTVSSAPLQ